MLEQATFKNYEDFDLCRKHFCTSKCGQLLRTNKCLVNLPTMFSSWLPSQWWGYIPSLPKVLGGKYLGRDNIISILLQYPSKDLPRVSVQRLSERLVDRPVSEHPPAVIQGFHEVRVIAATVIITILAHDADRPLKVREVIAWPPTEDE